MTTAVYTPGQRARAIATYREHGHAVALRSGPWSQATLYNWIKAARDAGELPPVAPKRRPPVKVEEERFEAPARPKGRRVGFPDLGPIPKRPFNPDEVCRSQAYSQLASNLT